MNPCGRLPADRWLVRPLRRYDAAAAEFEAVLALEPSDAVAANNRAVCLLYPRTA